MLDAYVDTGANILQICTCPDMNIQQSNNLYPIILLPPFTDIFTFILYTFVPLLPSPWLSQSEMLYMYLKLFSYQSFSHFILFHYFLCFVRFVFQISFMNILIVVYDYTFMEYKLFRDQMLHYGFFKGKCMTNVITMTKCCKFSSDIFCTRGLLMSFKYLYYFV